MLDVVCLFIHLKVKRNPKLEKLTKKTLGTFDSKNQYFEGYEPQLASKKSLTD